MNTKKEKIIKLYLEGKNTKDITKELDTYYSYVHGIIKLYKLEQKLANK